MWGFGLVKFRLMRIHCSTCCSLPMSLCFSSLLLDHACIESLWILIAYSVFHWLVAAEYTYKKTNCNVCWNWRVLCMNDWPFLPAKSKPINLCSPVMHWQIAFYNKWMHNFTNKSMYNLFLILTIVKLAGGLTVTCIAHCSSLLLFQVSWLPVWSVSLACY